MKGKRKKKADTNDGQKAKTAQGGKERNRLPEPNYTAKWPSPTQSRHLNPTTHSRGARGKI